MKTQATKIREIIGRYIYKYFAQRGYDVDVYFDKSIGYWYFLPTDDNCEVHQMCLQIDYNFGIRCIQTNAINEDNGNSRAKLIWNKEIEKNKILLLNS